MFTSVFAWCEWAFSGLLEEGKIKSKISFLEGHSKDIHFSSRSSADAAASRIFVFYWIVCYFAGVFLPGLVSPEKCCGKDGRPNKPYHKELLS